MYKLLDLYCGGGGCSKGYTLAGFEVVGVDIQKQKHYPYTFILEDAVEYLDKHYKEYDAIHASPPCQKYTQASSQWRLEGKEYPDLINKTREALIKTGKPYVIENVPNSPLINPIILNGSTFGLLVSRKRLFECNFYVKQPNVPKTKPAVEMGRRVIEGDIIQPVGHFSNVEYARKQMEIDWLYQKELAQAIPPKYTEYIGKYLIEHLS